MKKVLAFIIVSVLALSLVFAVGNGNNGSGNGAGGPIKYGECGDGECDYGENSPTYPYYCQKDCNGSIDKNKPIEVGKNGTGWGNMTRDEIKEQIRERVRERVMEMNKTKNATFGNCVVGSIVIKQSCYESTKDNLESCRNASLENASNGNVQDCLASYKTEMAVCKADFKDAKVICAENVKPRFFERIRYAFS